MQIKAGEIHAKDARRPKDVDIRNRIMKKYIYLLVMLALFPACEQKTTTVNPPEDKKESNTTVVNPPSEKKETNTTVVNPPGQKESTSTKTDVNVNTSPNP
jgi:hypothetical protein